jgi:two-component system, response regulator
MNNNFPLEILLIEDNDQDAELTMRAMREYNMGNKIVRLTDGQEALEYFFPSEVKKNEIPRLILLDLQLPGTNGLEVLKRLKDNEVTKIIPIVILTSSTEEKDIQACYHLGVNSYISKPVEFDSFLSMMKTLGMYWLLMNRAP